MKIGKAYGFFNCKASKKKIEAELPTIRKLVKTPSELELSLIEGVKNLKGDQDLVKLARQSQTIGIRYALEAKYLNATSRETAEELISILNKTHQSPLYSKKETFIGFTLYKDKGKYIFLA